MSTHRLGDHLSDSEIQSLICRVAEHVVCQLAADSYDGEVPHRYYDHVWDIAAAALRQALEQTFVPSLPAWAGEQVADDPFDAEARQTKVEV